MAEKRIVYALLVVAAVLVATITPLSPQTSITHEAQASPTRNPTIPPPQTAWNKTHGGSNYDWARSVQQTSDGGYIIAGCTYSFSAGSGDFWLVKADINGNHKWNKTYGGTSYDEAYSVEQTSDGGYITAGGTDSFGAGWGDLWLVKTDSIGNHQWNKTYGGTGNDWGFSVEQTSDGGYILAGCTSSFGAGSEDFWLVKTDSIGNHQWNKTYGGTGNDWGFSVEQTSDGGYILAGCTSSFGAGSEDFWLVKTDSNGNHMWNKTYGGTSYDEAFSVEQTSDGGYILAGYTSSFGAGSEDFWLVRTDPSGNQQWNKTYGGTNGDTATSVRQVSDGGYIVAGSTESFGGGLSDFWLLRTDSAGNHMWNKTYGGTNHDVSYSVQQTSDGGFILAGSTMSFGAGEEDFWLVKTVGGTSEAGQGLPLTVILGGAALVAVLAAVVLMKKRRS